MSVRLYFEVISNLPEGVQELPARLTWDVDGNASVLSEVSRRWGGVAVWRVADPAQEAELYRHAFMKLSFQHLNLRKALGLTADIATEVRGLTGPRRRVRFATSNGTVVEYITVAQHSPYSYPCEVNLYENDGTTVTRHSWFAFTPAERDHHLPVMRDAVLKLWRSELQLRKELGLKDTVPFNDLEIGVDKARRRVDRLTNELAVTEAPLDAWNTSPQ